MATERERVNWAVAGVACTWDRGVRVPGTGGVRVPGTGGLEYHFRHHKVLQNVPFSSS